MYDLEAAFRREWDLCDNPYPMQPVKPGGPRGQLCGGWTWTGTSWFPSDIWGKVLSSLV